MALRHLLPAFALGAGLLVPGCAPPGDTPTAPAIAAAAAHSSPGYDFTALAVLGDPAPGGGEFRNDFEPYGVNNRGDASFGADVTTGGEGIFVARSGSLEQIARSGQAAPGGGTYGFFGFFGALHINDPGDVSFVFALRPLGLPFGLNAGVYRSTHETVQPLVVPEVTVAPSGEVFAGAGFSPALNNRGQVAFSGLLHDADIAPGPPGVDVLGLGVGAFVADRDGRISAVARPGDAAPGGGIFDLAGAGWINDVGDVAFGGHIAGDVCLRDPVPVTVSLGCFGGAYLRHAASGQIETIAHQGSAVPGGGTCRFASLAKVNNRGQVLFGCDLTPEPGLLDVFGLFMHSNGVTIPIVRPGDGMPGGGHLLRAAFGDGTYLSTTGDVTFGARLDDGQDAIYVWSGGSLRLVVGRGTVLPGIGTIVSLVPGPDFLGFTIVPGPLGANDRGQILFTAVIDDGSGVARGVLVFATPRP